MQDCSPYLHILFMIHFNIILPPTPRFSKCSVPFWVSEQNFLFMPWSSEYRYPMASQPKRPRHAFSLPCKPQISQHFVRISHLIHLDVIIPTIFDTEQRLLSSSCGFLQPPVTSSLLGPNIILGNLFSDTLNTTLFP